MLLFLHFHMKLVKEQILLILLICLGTFHFSLKFFPLFCKSKFEKHKTFLTFSIKFFRVNNNHLPSVITCTVNICSLAYFTKIIFEFVPIRYDEYDKRSKKFVRYSIIFKECIIRTVSCITTSVFGYQIVWHNFLYVLKLYLRLLPFLEWYGTYLRRLDFEVCNPSSRTQIY